MRSIDLTALYLTGLLTYATEIIPYSRQIAAQAATFVAGREVIEPTATVVPDEGTAAHVLEDLYGLLNCFSKTNKHCAGIDRKWAVVAMNEFCKKLNGQVLSLAQPTTSVKMTYIYYPLPETENAERGAVTLQVGFAPDNKLNLAYKMEFQSCYDTFKRILDGCDTKGITGKRGGMITNNPSVISDQSGDDALFYLLDPNPRPDYSNVRWTGDDHVSDATFVKSDTWCTNEASHFSPNPSNVATEDTIWTSCMIGEGGYWRNVSPATSGNGAELGCVVDDLDQPGRFDP